MARKKMPTDIHAVMVAWGRKGGKARAKKLTPAERKALGERLADARRKKIPPAERSRIAKAAVAKREEYRKKRASKDGD
jgi:hypothetical protein